MIEIDTGDTVFHRPSRETWLVAHCEHGELMWVGWPEGYARLDDCLLVNKASAESRIRLLHSMATSNGIRGGKARAKLEEYIDLADRAEMHDINIYDGA